MKIIIVGINFAPEIISSGLYTTELAESLSAMGDNVHVISGQPYYPHWKVFAGHSRVLWTRGTLPSGVKFVRCPHYVPQNPTGIRRIVHHFTFAIFSFPVLLWKCITCRPDLVLVVAPSLLSAPLSWAAAKLFHAKCWLHVQDFEVDAAVATGLIRRGTTIERFAFHFDRMVHRIFDKVSSISSAMIAKLHHKGVPASKTYEMRNWAKIDEVFPLDRASIYHDFFKVGHANVVLYSGNIANKQGLEILPDVAKLLVNRRDIVFVICGDGTFLKTLKVLSAGLPNISFHPLQPSERLGELMGLATIHVLPQIAGVADSVLPSKLTNMLASGRPVIATAIEGSALAAEVEGCGFVTPPGDANALADAIVNLVDNPDLCAKLGIAARRRAVMRWDKNEIIYKFRQEAYDLCGLSMSEPSPVRVSSGDVILKK